MDPFVLVVLVVIVGGAAAWWFLRRRTPPPVEDEWTLPPLEASDQGGSTARPIPGESLQPFDREALLRRDRSFDPTRWDNTPDASADAEDDGWAATADPGEDLPRFFDRDYLQRRSRPDEPPEA